MRNLKQVLYGMLFIIALSNCDPEVDIEIPTIKKQLVVDGWIEQNNYAYVLLTYNTSYFSDLDSASIRGLIATRAKVTLTDGNETEVLTLVKDTNYFPPYVYRSFEIIGKIGNTYSIYINDETGTASASTTIQKPVELDSIWYEPFEDRDTEGIIKGVFKDNYEEHNFYRTFTKKNPGSTRFYPTLISNFEDTYFNGEHFTFALKKGPESYLKPIESVYFKKGDTTYVKITSVEKKCYEFWRAYEDEVLNSGNPFASNFKNINSTIYNGLGIWCGYGSTYYKVIAK